jgi:uncharacterized membrane protein YtjA (UPF0391 family)
MQRWALAFLVGAVIAAILSFAGFTGTAAGIAEILAMLFLLLFAGAMLLSRRSVRHVPAEARAEERLHDVHAI